MSEQASEFGESLFQKSARKFRRDRFGKVGLAIVCLYAAVALGVKVGLFCTLETTTTIVGPQFVEPGEVYQRILPPPPAEMAPSPQAT